MQDLNTRNKQNKANNAKKSQNVGTPHTSEIAALAHVYTSLIECAYSNCRVELDDRKQSGVKKIKTFMDLMKNGKNAGTEDKQLLERYEQKHKTANMRAQDCILKHCQKAAASTLKAIAETMKKEIKYRGDHGMPPAKGIENDLEKIQKFLQNSRPMDERERYEIFPILALNYPKLA